jgi:hypothetical protein
MDELLKAIEEALEKRGISASAASQAAVGNPSLIKNLRLSTASKERRHPFENIQALADVLGLEVYVGPPRPQPTATGFAEAAKEFVRPSLDGNPEALRMGFLPIAWHQADPTHKSSSHLALARHWIDDQQLDIERLYAIGMPNDDMAPSIAQDELLLIEEGFEPTPEATLCAFTVDMRLRVGWLLSPQKACYAAFYERRLSMPNISARTRGPMINPIGRVVMRLDTMPGPWLDAEEKHRLLDYANEAIRR